jgi:hypothetical protein
MNIDLAKLTFDEIVSLRNKVNNYLYNYEDGYLYICKVNSFGRHWDEYVSNAFTLEELCNRYNGDDGILNVYSTNPNLGHIMNYGDLMYIESQDDYNKWSKYKYLGIQIKNTERELDEWDNRDNVPFVSRPFFEPMYTREDLAEMKKEYEEYDMSFVPPRNYDYDDVR